VTVESGSVGDPPGEKPLVSVILPTYKRAGLLGHAIRNVLAQTLSSIELIVVDDCSPDDTRAVVESFDDPRVVYVRNASNLKLPGSLNVGFDRARGQYMTWTSDDNLYDADAIRQMVEAIRAEGCDFVFADYYEFVDLDPGTGKPVDTRRRKLPDSMPVENGNRIGACFLYTRKVYEEIGAYDTGLFLVEDYDYFLRVSRRFRIHHIPQALYYFRRHDDSLYVSRFCEVKSADLLVRYKNGYLSESDALGIAVGLVIGNIERLRNPLLRWVYLALKGTSYRLTTLYRRMMQRYFANRLEREVVGILRRFGSKQIQFDEAKVSLENVLQRAAVIQYF
jgi:glycosyltransferase involved in cell wall biosynthesis